MAPRKPSDGRDPRPIKDRLKDSREALKTIRDKQQQDRKGGK